VTLLGGGGIRHIVTKYHKVEGGGQQKEKTSKRSLMDLGVFALKTALKHRFLKNSNATSHTGGGGVQANVTK
jgi:hypothetical protein